MQEAEAIARTKALNSMSLHVFERNSPAVTLYNSMGYEALGRQPVVTHPLIRYDGQLLLMGKSLD
jgi:ribosomal protein S18 acetylase RimI-like enzyme